MEPASCRLGVLLSAMAVAVALAGCAQATLDSKAVKEEAQSIASVASEGSILSNETTRGRMKESFVQVEAADLADQAAKSQQDLEPALAVPELKITVQHLQTVAETTSSELRALETDPRNLDRISALAKRLAKLRDAASNVDDRL